MAEGVPTNNQRGQRSGPCRLWGGLDKARHIVPTALLVRVQRVTIVHFLFFLFPNPRMTFVLENLLKWGISRSHL